MIIGVADAVLGERYSPGQVMSYSYECRSGHWGMGHVSPGKVYHLSAQEMAWAIEELKLDILITNPTSDLKWTDLILHWTKEFKKLDPRPMIVTLDCDTSGLWQFWYPSITTTILEMFKESDVVACRVPSQVHNVKAVGGTNPIFIPEVNIQSTYSKGDIKSRDDRIYIVSPKCHSDSYNSRRNGLINTLIVKELSKLYPDLKPVIFCTNLTNRDGGLGEVTEFEVLESVGMDPSCLKILRGDSISEFNNIVRYYMSRAVLIVNMDMEISTGHWSIDAGSFGTPFIGSSTAGFHELVLGKTGCVPPYDIESAVEVGKRLIEDENYWNSRSKAVLEKSKIYSAERVRSVYEQLYKRFREGKEVTLLS